MYNRGHNQPIILLDFSFSSLLSWQAGFMIMCKSAQRTQRHISISVSLPPTISSHLVPHHTYPHFTPATAEPDGRFNTPCALPFVYRHQAPSPPGSRPPHWADSAPARPASTGLSGRRSTRRYRSSGCSADLGSWERRKRRWEAGSAVLALAGLPMGCWDFWQGRGGLVGGWSRKVRE